MPGDGAGRRRRWRQRAVGWRRRSPPPGAWPRSSATARAAARPPRRRTMTTDTAPAASRPRPNHRNQPVTASTALCGGCGRGGNSGVVGIELLPGRCAARTFDVWRKSERRTLPSSPRLPLRLSPSREGPMSRRRPRACTRRSGVRLLPRVATAYRRLLARHPVDPLARGGRDRRRHRRRAARPRRPHRTGARGLGRHPSRCSWPTTPSPRRAARRLDTRRAGQRWCRHRRSIRPAARAPTALASPASTSRPARSSPTSDVVGAGGRLPLLPVGWLAVPIVESPPSGAADGERVQLASDGIVVAGEAVVVGRIDDVTLIGVPADDAAIDPAGGRVGHAGGAPAAVSGRPPGLSARAWR